MPAAGGEETELTELRPIVNRYWAVGATGIYFLDEATDASGGSKGKRALKRFRFDNRRVEVVSSSVPPTVTSVTSVRGLSVSPDERSFLWVQPGPSLFQIMLVDGFR
jgi:hypothetical protein